MKSRRQVHVWRWVAGPVVGALVAFLVIDTDAAPRPETTVETQPQDALGECFETGPLATIGDVNRFVARVRGDDAFAGGDVGASVQLQDGRGLFVFGDTLRYSNFSGRQFVHNSMLVFSPDCGRVVLPKDHGAIVPDRADGVGYWPMSIALISYPGYDDVGVGVQRVRSTGGDDVFDFEILGPAVARFRVPVGQAPQLVSVRDVGPDDADTQHPMWGASAVVDQGWVYLYGTSRPPAANLQGFALRVARTRPQDIGSPDRWRYWDGRRWSSDPNSSATLIPSRGGVSQTLSVFRRGASWYAVSKKDEVLGTDLTIWKAPAPTGPFIAAPRSASIPSDAITGTLRYMPLAHPDLLPQPGTVVVSYSENNTDFSKIADDPRRYRPRFLRVKLP